MQKVRKKRELLLLIFDFLFTERKKYIIIVNGNAAGAAIGPSRVYSARGKFQSGSKKKKGIIIMNKTQLVEAVAAEANLSKKDAEAAVKATFAAIEGALVKGDKVQLIGFGTFETRVRGERTGKNPRTGETVKIAACKAPAFKAGKALKDIVNK